MTIEEMEKLLLEMSTEQPKRCDVRRNTGLEMEVRGLPSERFRDNKGGKGGKGGNGKGWNDNGWNGKGNDKRSDVN